MATVSVKGKAVRFPLSGAKLRSADSRTIHFGTRRDEAQGEMFAYISCAGHYLEICIADVLGKLHSIISFDCGYIWFMCDCGEECLDFYEEIEELGISDVWDKIFEHAQEVVIDGTCAGRYKI
ncbi:hypothetical protein FACS1894120_6160 [Clostridia bacterium]|nr:hypothetical protein FACS1894120_6160 [Clostridia bacterium]